MKKKVGILTFQRTTNYGAQFQNYALQEYLKQFDDLEIEVINYENEKISATEKRVESSEYKGIKGLIKYILIGKNRKIKWENFERFRKENIHLTKEYTKENIKQIENQYDFFLVGSDQVWNTDITGNDFNYMLNFVTNDKKKYSYAASIGMDNINVNNKNKVINDLKKFQKINVREETAKALLEENGLTNVSVVMDPVFLIDKKTWLEKMNLSFDKEKYIFVYMIDNVKENMKKIKRLAKKEKLKVIYINNDIFNILGVKNIKDASPTEFLNYLYNSKYIITGSFHAICLSLIFNKDFYYILNKKFKRNSRLTDLVQKANIKN